MARGDQIYVFREFLTLEGIYEHHGIDCGNGSVIHYRKLLDRARIERTSLADFTQGNPVYRCEYPSNFCFIPDDVVKRAESRLGEEKYNLLFNNCEHFATWCKIGITDSKQVRDFVPTISRLEVDDLFSPLQKSLQATPPDNAQQLVDQALTDIKGVWDRLQPQYQEALREKNTWQRVAAEAVRQNRDDLARAALHKKLDYQKRARSLEEQLQQLAQMTETLIRNSENLPVA